MRIFSYERKLKEMPKMIIITTQNKSLSRINYHGDRTILRQSRDGQVQKCNPCMIRSIYRR